MNKELETKLRLRVRKLVESVLNEEPPMEKPDDFSPKPIKSTTPIKIGKMTVYAERGFIFISKGNRDIQMSMEDASKLGQYLYRVAGKV